jgi:hypothetical protein
VLDGQNGNDMFENISDVEVTKETKEELNKQSPTKQSTSATSATSPKPPKSGIMTINSINSESKDNDNYIIQSYQKRNTLIKKYVKNYKRLQKMLVEILTDKTYIEQKLQHALDNNYPSANLWDVYPNEVLTIATDSEGKERLYKCHKNAINEPNDEMLELDQNCQISVMEFLFGNKSYQTHLDNSGIELLPVILEKKFRSDMSSVSDDKEDITACCINVILPSNNDRSYHLTFFWDEQTAGKYGIRSHLCKNARSKVRQRKKPYFNNVHSSKKNHFSINKRKSYSSVHKGYNYNNE